MTPKQLASRGGDHRRNHPARSLRVPFLLLGVQPSLSKSLQSFLFALPSSTRVIVWISLLEVIPQLDPEFIRQRSGSFLLLTVRSPFEPTVLPRYEQDQSLHRRS